MESYDYDEVKKTIQDMVLCRIDMASSVSDEEIINIIDDMIMEQTRKTTMSLKMRMKLRNDIFNSLRGLDAIQILVDDKDISEIMVNGYKNIYYEKKGKIYRWDGAFESDERYNNVIQQIVSKINRVVNESTPIADARLEDGSRVNVVVPPVAIDGAALTIRKFPEKVIGMEELIERGTISDEAALFLNRLVLARYNIFISGGTSSGKTTMLNALAGYIPEDERIITVEDSAELQIKNIPNIVRLEVKNSNGEGSHNTSIRDLIKSSLRMRPDRIIVGEVRDEAAIDLLSAYNTGHDGSISTGHSNSCQDMLIRLESMVLMGSAIPVAAIRRQISSAIDIIIHLARVRDKTRKVMEITEVVGMKGDDIIVNPLYVFREMECTNKERVIGSLVRTGNKLVNEEKLIRAGLMEEGEY